ncbi:MAG: hypothetical protein ACI8PZ_005226, partial [Myxococcota bacterium]
SGKLRHGLPGVFQKAAIEGGPNGPTGKLKKRGAETPVPK